MSFQVMLQQLTTGFGQTLLIFFLTLLFSLPLGMVVYFGRVSRFKPLSWIVKAYISIMRGTPLMLQLLLWYFGPFYLWGMNIGNYKFTAIILGCSLNYAAYFAEIYRSGIVSSTMQHISRRSTAAASSPCRWDSMRQHSFWDTIKARHFSKSYYRRL